MEDPQLFWTGANLKKAVFDPKVKRRILIDSLVPEHSVTMFYAADGIGKSTLALQLAIQAASGFPVFDEFAVERPLKILYLMAERHRLEAFERMEFMSTRIGSINWDNFAITDSLQGFNICNQKDQDVFVGGINEIVDNSFMPELIVFDPIYALVPKGLNQEDGASAIAATVRGLMVKYRCSMLLVHHANRGVKAQDGNRVGLDYGGHRNISSQCSGVFNIKGRKGGTELVCEKDTYSLLSHGFGLDYDFESYTSCICSDDSSANKLEKGDRFIKAKFIEGKTFTSAEFRAVTGCSKQVTRNRLGDRCKEGSIINISPVGRVGCYKVLEAS